MIKLPSFLTRKPAEPTLDPVAVYIHSVDWHGTHFRDEVMLAHSVYVDQVARQLVISPAVKSFTIYIEAAAHTKPDELRPRTHAAGSSLPTVVQPESETVN